MRINHNIPALQSFHAIRNANRDTEATMKKLSTGYRINSAKDNASGVAISNKMKLQISGLDRASQNAMDGISLIQTADGALTEVHNMLQRMRELSVKAVTDTLEDEDREKIQDEIDALLKEIDDISMRTEFNTIKLFGPKASGKNGFNDVLMNGVGSLSSVTSKGAIAGDAASPGFPDGDFTFTLLNETGYAWRSVIEIGDLAADVAAAGGSLDLNGETISFDSTDDHASALNKIKAAAEDLGYTALIEKSSDNTQDTLVIYSQDYLSISNRVNISTSAVNIPSTENYPDLPCIVDTESAKFTVANGNSVQIKSTRFDFAAKTVTITLDEPYEDMEAVFSLNIKTVDNRTELYDNSTNPAQKVPEGTYSITTSYRDYSEIILQTGPNKDMELNIVLAQIDCKTLGIETMSSPGIFKNDDPIGICDRAIAFVSKERSKLGAYQNRLEHTTTSLDITQDNMKEALSRIIDTDMAKEMTQYTQYNIISQAGISILAQANQRPQQILQLVGQ